MTSSWVNKTTAAIFAGVVVLVVLLCFVSGKSGIRLRAEKKLYQARKSKVDALSCTTSYRTEFVERALDQYRRIVLDFGNHIEDVEGIEYVVVNAQMDLADLEFQVGWMGPARDDFERVLDLELSSPAVRMKAVFSAARLSELIGDNEHAIALYKTLYEDYLSVENSDSILFDGPYLVTPLRLAGLYRKAGNGGTEALWLEKALTLYQSRVAKSSDAHVQREARFDLLAAFILQGKWDDALAYCAELARRYTDPRDSAAIMYVEARIYLSGKNDPSEASRRCRTLYEEYPSAIEAPRALLFDAELRLAGGDVEGAKATCEEIIRMYPDDVEMLAAAEWRLARIEESRGRWDEAVRYYERISENYRGTYYGFKAPVEIAKGFQHRGDLNAANDSYERAIEDYDAVIAGEFPPAIKIMAEEGVLQVHAEQRHWAEAIRHLLELPDRYSDYKQLRTNYVTAAAIYESELDDRKKAIATLHTCIERFPRSEAARAARAQIEQLRSAD